ncbi:FeoA family protein [Aestuariimicrobium ganziense]|uniref:FeoA family protein n=1 Tax=Aestuariimicrobium ganziense TaxID=2773677 RepID=UPI001942956A|nr:FeoA family protein [Aestuariimicrobium ganziense]
MEYSTRHPHEALALTHAPLRRPVLLRRVDGEPAVCRRLAALGLRRGAHLEVVQRTVGGGIVVAVAEARIALGRELADRLTVEPR